MKTKLLTLFAALVCATQAFAADFSVNGIYYKTLNDYPTVEVIKDYSYERMTSINIPATVYYNGTTYNVTTIGAQAFNWCNNLTAITLPNSVTTIGDWAFNGCSNLPSITIPKSVTTIGRRAFANCYGLTSITIPRSVAIIGEQVFGGCPMLETITVEYGNQIYHSAGNCLIETATKTLHSGCKNSIIPTDGSVTAIAPAAFIACYTLPSITIPSSVIKIGQSAFGYCYNIETISVEAGNPTYHSAGNCLIETATKTLHTGCKNSIIPTDGSVTTIGNSAFHACQSLTAITIPNNITAIGDYAFSECSSLIKIILPNSITTIGEYAFNYCSKLTEITIPNSVTSIGNHAFGDCNKLNRTNYTGDIASWCKIEFGYSAANPIYYSKNLFINDIAVQDLVIPEGVTSIGNYTFYNCSGLTSVIIPSSVTSIGYDAFYNCSNLTEITCLATTPPAINSSYTFYKVDKTIPLYVTAQSIEAYKAAEYWKEFTNILPLSISAESITLDQTAMTLVPNKAQQLTATILPEDAVNKNCTWKSSNEEVAIVLNNGFIVALAEGATTITATTDDGGLTATCDVTVTTVSGISLDKTSLELSVGSTEQLTETIIATEASYQLVNWATSDANVATVENGLVTAVGTGVAAIGVATADGGFVATCAVTVKTAGPATEVQQVQVNPSGVQKVLVDGVLYIVKPNGDKYTIDGRKVE